MFYICGVLYLEGAEIIGSNALHFELGDYLETGPDAADESVEVVLLHFHATSVYPANHFFYLLNIQCSAKRVNKD